MTIGNIKLNKFLLDLGYQKIETPTSAMEKNSWIDEAILHLDKFDSIAKKRQKSF